MKQLCQQFSGSIQLMNFAFNGWTDNNCEKTITKRAELYIYTLHFTLFVDAVPHHRPRRATPHGRIERCCGRTERNNERPPTTGETPPGTELLQSNSGVAGWPPCSHLDYPTRCRWATARQLDRRGPGVPCRCWWPSTRCFDGRGVA